MDRITIADIRAQYPAPKTVAQGFYLHGAYCVGGAICLAEGSADASPFPDEGKLADVLQYLNPKLSDDLALEYADDLLTYNDKGNFAKAWAVATKALAYR